MSGRDAVYRLRRSASDEGYATQELVASLPAFENGVLALKFAPDGRLLAASSRDGIVKIWELPSGKLRLHVQAVDRVFAAVFGGGAGPGDGVGPGGRAAPPRPFSICSSRNS